MVGFYIFIYSTTYQFANLSICANQKPDKPDGLMKSAGEDSFQ